MAIEDDLIGADRYFSERIDGQLWSVTDLDTQTRALLTASRAINSLRFVGSKTDSDQETEFPRNGDTETPTAVKEALYEEAYSLMKGADPDTDAGNIFVTSRVFGKVRTDYDFRTAPEYIVAGITSQRAWLLLKPYLDPARGVNLRRRS